MSVAGLTSSGWAIGATSGSGAAQLVVGVSSTMQQQYVSSRFVIILYKIPVGNLAQLIFGSNARMVIFAESG